MSLSEVCPSLFLTPLRQEKRNKNKSVFTIFMLNQELLQPRFKILGRAGVLIFEYCFNIVLTFRCMVPMTNWRLKEERNEEGKKKDKQLYI